MCARGRDERFHRAALEIGGRHGGNGRGTDFRGVCCQPSSLGERIVADVHDDRDAAACRLHISFGHSSPLRGGQRRPFTRAAVDVEAFHAGGDEVFYERRNEVEIDRSVRMHGRKRRRDQTRQTCCACHLCAISLCAAASWTVPMSVEPAPASRQRPKCGITILRIVYPILVPLLFYQATGSGATEDKPV